MELETLAANARHHLTVLQDEMRHVSLWDGEIEKSIRSVDDLLEQFAQPHPSQFAVQATPGPPPEIARREGLFAKAEKALDTGHPDVAHGYLALIEQLS